MKKKTKMWCCVGSKGHYDYTSLAYTKKSSIEKFCSIFQPGHDPTWDQYQEKWGWKCVKVYITIEAR